MLALGWSPTSGANSTAYSYRAFKTVVSQSFSTAEDPVESNPAAEDNTKAEQDT